MTTDTRQANHAGSADSEDGQAPRKSSRSLLRRILRVSLWILLTLVLLTVLLLGVVFYLAGTDSGFARLSSIANDRVPGLSIDRSSGNLREGISAEGITFTNESIQAEVTNLSSQWRLKCLMQRRFCLDSVTIEQLDITTFASEETTPEVPREGPIELPDIVLPVDVTIDDISIGLVRFQAPGDAPVQTVENINLSARTEGALATIDNVSLEYQQFAARLNGNITLTGQYPLDLTLSVEADDVLPDSLPEGDGMQPIDVQMMLDDSLANLAVSTRVTGVAELQLDARVQPLQQNLPATVDIVAEELGWPVQSKSMITASGTRINVSGTMDDYDFGVQTSLTGEQVPDTDLAINGVANTQRIALPSINIDTLGGNANASADLSLAQPMSWTTSWTLADIDPSIQVPDLQGTLNGNIDASGQINDGRWSLKLEQALVEGTLRNLPFRLDARLQKGMNDVWFIENFTLNNERNQILASGIVSDELDIKADVRLPRLQNLMPGLAGDFNASIVAGGSRQSPDVSAQATADVIRYNDILLRALAINADITQLFTNTSSLDITLDSASVGANDITNAALTLSGQRSDHQLTLNADGPENTAIDLALSGSLDDSLNWSGLLEKVRAVVPGHNVQLAEPTALSWQNAAQSVSVAPHCWNLTDVSTLCLENEVRTDVSGQAAIVLNQYSLEQLNELIPGDTRVAGELAANVDLRWNSEGPDRQRAVVSATINNAVVTTVDALGDSVTFGYDTIVLDANAAPEDVVAQLQLNSQTLGNATIEATLNPADPESALRGSVLLEGLQLDVARAFLPDFDTVSGTLSADGELGGTLSQPQYNGVIVLDTPVLQADILPLPVTGGNITARITGQSLDLSGDILSDQGSINILGRGRLNPQDWNAEVTLVGENLRVVTSPLQDSTVNHNVRIVANARRITVDGDIDVPRAVIDVEELPEGAATVSSDIVVVEDEEEELVPPVVADSERNLAVNLNVALGEDVSLSAYGLNANLTGDIDVRVRGNRPPQLGGEIQVVDGIFKKYGQDLVANGQVLFAGPVDVTRLSIDAVREIESEDRVAGLRIQGTVESPEITLFTEPSDKSQDAILSYIILGRDINEASDQEADLLATAALALAVKGGSTVGGGIADALGIQEFGLETRGRGDNAELVVSGRLNDRLLLRYGRNVFDSESTLYLRYDLTKKLYLEAAQGAQRAVDLFYSFSF